MTITVIRTQFTLTSADGTGPRDQWAFDPTGLDKVDHRALYRSLPHPQLPLDETSRGMREMFVELGRRLGHEVAFDERITDKSKFIEIRDRMGRAAQNEFFW
jgi:hypothetical protein